jgi:ABC-type phosphate transport system substrate-binding protein
MRNRIFTCMMIINLYCSALSATADIAVIVHNDSPVVAITLREAVDIFLGKTRQLRSGMAIIPLDQRSGRAVRDEFYRRAANKSASQLKAYWARQVFTGQGEPPRSLLDDIQVKYLVSENPNMIGYIDAAMVDGSVKSVLLVR